MVMAMERRERGTFATIEARLKEIESRASRATAGPWIDLMKIYHDRMQAFKKRTGRWYHGSRRASLPVTLLAQATVRGESVCAEDIPERVDWYDLNHVIGLRWSDFPQRTTVITDGFFRPEDADFIAHARADVPWLVDQLRSALIALRATSEEHDVIDNLERFE